MESSDAIAIIDRERRFIEKWGNQDRLPDAEGLIKDRDITRCLRALREAAPYAPLHEGTMVAKIVELA